MEEIPEGFEWDPDKAEQNLRDHGVSFREASEVFADPRFRFLFDSEHSDDEDRYLGIGFTRKGRLLRVGYCERGDNIRIINAWKADTTYRAAYDEE